MEGDRGRGICRDPRRLKAHSGRRGQAAHGGEAGQVAVDGNPRGFAVVSRNGLELNRGSVARTNVHIPAFEPDERNGSGIH